MLKQVKFSYKRINRKTNELVRQSAKFSRRNAREMQTVDGGWPCNRCFTGWLTEGGSGGDPLASRPTEGGRMGGTGYPREGPTTQPRGH